MSIEASKISPGPWEVTPFFIDEPLGSQQLAVLDANGNIVIAAMHGDPIYIDPVNVPLVENATAILATMEEIVSQCRETLKLDLPTSNLKSFIEIIALVLTVAIGKAKGAIK